MVGKVICCVALTLGVCDAYAQQQVMLDKVVAVVGGSSILYSEVSENARQILSQRRAQGYTSDRDPQNEALEALMTQKLLYNQALIDSVDVNLSAIASSVEMQVNAMAEEAGGIAQLEKQHNMAIFNFRETLRRQYEERTYAESMQGNVVSKVTIIPGEVERFYKRAGKDSLPIIPEQYVYAQITRFPKSIVLAKQRAKERLLEMRERIIKGDAKFETLARMYSQDPGTMMRGGEMPDPVNLNEIEPQLSAAIERLKPSQISEVVETQLGFHIAQLIEKRGSLYRFRHILLRPSYTNDEVVEAMHTLDSLVRVVRMDSITFDKAALHYSDDALSKKNGGVVSNHDILMRFAADATLTQTAFYKEDFGRFGKLDDYNALRRLKVGQISPAFLTQDLSGNELAKVVKLVQIIPTHRASLNEDYLRLEELALQAKQTKVFDEWLSKRIEAMYIFIVPEFRNGEFRNKYWVK